MKVTGLIDFHTHILPGIDDGSRDEEMTRAMLEEESRQGVGCVVATPHFYASNMSIEGFLKRREEALRASEGIRTASPHPLPALIAGAEVYYFAGIGRAREVPRLCVGETKTLLLEMPFRQWTDEMLGDVNDLIAKQKLDIVLAHVERYVEFQRDKRVWDRVMALPVTIQLNAEDFLRKDGLLRKDQKKRFCLEFLSQRPDTILGSDCHNLTSRRPNLADARQVIAAALGESALERAGMAARNVLSL